MGYKRISDYVVSVFGRTGAVTAQAGDYAAFHPLKYYAKLSDSKSTGTHGGTFTSGGWRTRDLNTEDNDADNIVSVSANQFTLSAGRYRIYARCPALGVSYHRAKIRNVTDSADILASGNVYTSSTVEVQSDAIIQGEFTISGTKTFEIHHKCTDTKSSYGFGLANNSDSMSEVYTVVEIWKIS